jgi:hypothetical protein
MRRSEGRWRRAGRAALEVVADVIEMVVDIFT